METTNAAGGYGPPGGSGGGGGWGPPGGGYGAPPGGGGYGAPPGGGYGSPPAGGFGAPTGFVPPGGPMIPGMPGAGGDVNTTTPLLLNVIALLFCGGTLMSAPASIAGIVFAIQAKNAKGAGDVMSARAKAKYSMIAFAGAMLIGIVMLVIWQFLTPPTRH